MARQKPNPSHINKYTPLKKYKRRTKPKVIGLLDVRKRIDRMQFSVRYDPCGFGEVLEGFESAFRRADTWRVRKRRRRGWGGERLVRKFEYGYGGCITLLLTVDLVPDPRWFTAAVFDPNRDVQPVLFDILSALLPPVVAPLKSPIQGVYLSQVEFAWDFYPADPGDLYALKKALTHNMVLKNARIGSYREYKGTVYLGRGGDKREGFHGLTVYLKDDGDGKRCVRVEVQLNRGALRRGGIGIYSLPLSADRINPFDYLEFREGLNDVTTVKLINAVFNKQEKKPYTDPWKTAIWEMTKKRFLAEDICERILGTPFTDFTELYGIEPVPEQINGKKGFKALKKDYRLTHQVDDFFHKGNLKKRLLADIDKGYVRRTYQSGKELAE